jgi:hypothetical protein
MDSQIDLLIKVLKINESSSYERHAVLLRAGALAEVYLGASDEIIREVFGLLSEGLLENDVNHDAGTAICPLIPLGTNFAGHVTVNLQMPTLCIGLSTAMLISELCSPVMKPVQS